ncbi:jacalin-related lectin 3-like isoform X2 [Cornus florida]|uniref:jacalin-related lectin 3-like isoform X2 n=1 Tax=Cornus florida TaxID=4283 RepID=UPI002897E879|nr:jacalin-related lectin 3-like isoform X2 [Cornus florida]XP_059648681.1 jacalin-related lectin 3-like isoform X2 [Cornus florida]XP_059648682.1 jacalin-related lectin 3-like isoform X2 [Cornus florida]XP_059648683.1 jacalin-related lectin 3-like isoform X2 [Cornus florida]
MGNWQTVTFGPYGSREPGNQWNDGTYSTVREVIIYSAGSEIGSIQVVYDKRGRPVSGNKHGFCSQQSYRVKLNYPTEYLVSISGYCESYLNTCVVKSLTLHSNIKQYGPYGKEEGSRFMTPLNAGKIVGFFGRVGERLDSIGVYIKPFKTTIPCFGLFGTTSEQQWDVGTNHAFGTTGGQHHDDGTTHSFETTGGQQCDDGADNALGTTGGLQWDDGTSGMDTIANGQTVTFGPYGSSEPGNQWNDGIYSTVREIIIYSAGLEIESIQVVYDNGGKAVWGNKHGFCTRQPNRVKLNYPTEYLVSISGYCGYYLSTYLVVKSLTLHSNIKQYGPYGKEEGSHFMTPLTVGKIVGFFGRVGERLDSIGVYIKPFQTITPCVGLFGTTGVGTNDAFGTIGGQHHDDGTNHSFETTGGQQCDDGTDNALETTGGHQCDDGTSGMDTMANGQTVTFGPYGSLEPGNQWNDGIYSTVREIIIYSAGLEIESIQVVYDNRGKAVWGNKHGFCARQPNRANFTGFNGWCHEC